MCFVPFFWWMEWMCLLNLVELIDLFSFDRFTVAGSLHCLRCHCVAPAVAGCFESLEGSTYRALVKRIPLPNSEWEGGLETRSLGCEKIYINISNSEAAGDFTPEKEAQANLRKIL